MEGQTQDNVLQYPTPLVPKAQGLSRAARRRVSDVPLGFVVYE